jgi:hypothetical protein
MYNIYFREKKDFFGGIFILFFRPNINNVWLERLTAKENIATVLGSIPVPTTLRGGRFSSAELSTRKHQGRYDSKK